MTRDRSADISKKEFSVFQDQEGKFACPGVLITAAHADRGGSFRNAMF